MSFTSCCSSFGDAAERQFNKKTASQELARYRQKGPAQTTRLLLDGLAKAGANGLVMDVGSGIGSLTFGLLERGLTGAVAVDASSAYIAAAAEEAGRRGCAGAIQFVHGDFLAVAPRLPRASVVTLDRVVCCYPSWTLLLEEALRKTQDSIALSYPRDVWYVRGGVAAENSGRRLSGNSFRTFVHPTEGMARLIERAGFDLFSRAETWAWCADVYTRRGSRPER